MTEDILRFYFVLESAGRLGVCGIDFSPQSVTC
jgi:hypothetical protein